MLASRVLCAWFAGLNVALAAYHIKFVRYHNGEAYTSENGGYLTAQRYYSRDIRNSASTYVELDLPGYAGVWELEPFGPYYHIKFVRFHNGGAYTSENGGYLTAQRWYSTDLRNSEYPYASTYVELDQPGFAGVWALESVGGSEYHIKFVKYHNGEAYGSENGGYLTAQRWYSTDKRNSVSPYASTYVEIDQAGFAGVFALETVIDLTGAGNATVESSMDAGEGSPGAEVLAAAMTAGARSLIIAGMVGFVAGASVVGAGLALFKRRQDASNHYMCLEA